MTTHLRMPAQRYGPALAATQLDDADRVDAGHRLAALLRPFRSRQSIVLAIPPGGVAVAREVARVLRLPLDVLLSREFNLPRYPALAAGALSEGGGLCFNAALLRLPGVAPQTFWDAAQKVRNEVARLTLLYRRSRPAPQLNRHIAILVDDGLGPGLAQLAAIQALRYAHVQRCIVATPFSTAEAAERIAHRADLLVSLTTISDDQTSPPMLWRRALGDDDGAALLEHHLSQRVVESDE